MATARAALFLSNDRLYYVNIYNNILWVEIVSFTHKKENTLKDLQTPRGCLSFPNELIR